jgi:hypothetical protein
MGLSGPKGRLAEQQVGSAGEVGERLCRTCVTGVDERLAVVLEPDEVRLDGVAGRRYGH